MDKSIWAHWYNLPGADKDGYLAWLHGKYMPKILANSGVLWAAHYKIDQKPIPPRIIHTQDPGVGNGNDYILLFGAESTHAFSRDAASFAKGATDRFTSQLSDDDKKMLAKRNGVRVSIMTEEARVHGPECGKREGLRLPAPCIQLGSFNGPTPEIEEELLAWYADWRMTSLAKLPGCLGMRKMVSTVGWNKHGVMYEFLSLSARNAGMVEMGRLYPEMEAWTNVCVPKLVHAPGSPHIAERIFALEK
ncbi:MAG TPA: hypothetical protein VK642_12245 [Burkholderiales bacterium]|nr:hypothetical protein [Burkholderiales bacterium]